MLFKEFIDETRRVERFYEKELSEEQQKIWFHNLKNMEIARYKYILGELYRRSKFFPTLADIVKLDDELGHYKRPDEKKYKLVQCNICRGKGVIRYSKEIGYHRYEFVCRCNCQNSVKYSCFPSMNEVGITEEIILKSRAMNKNEMTVQRARQAIQNFMKIGKER